MTSIILYVSKIWNLREVENTRLAMFERKTLRSIYGPCINLDTGEWRTDYNKGLRN